MQWMVYGTAVTARFNKRTLSVIYNIAVRREKKNVVYVHFETALPMVSNKE